MASRQRRSRFSSLTSNVIAGVRKLQLAETDGAKPPAAESGPREVAEDALKGASPRGSILALFGLLATGLFLSGNTPTELAQFAAFGAGASVAVTLLFDYWSVLIDLSSFC